ncbi:MAG TPA: T9SS type A sorting domain-containing protein, partial [Flavobacteriia bacterium]|nr:T9SS type A sorting domain-containing protein [Flavobacteriia bacterium]
NFIFDKFYMPKGGKVYLYNDDRSDLLGAYTDIQNQKSGMLGTWLVKGDRVWIEYYEPKEVKGQGKLHIANATHGYRTKETYQKVLGDSGDCNHDVDCPIGADWEQHRDNNKKSVALILNNGNDWCSGALINNTNNDQTPYLLTANHCIDGQNTANWAFRFGWISPNPVCAATTASTNGPTNMTISGATVKANNANSDFALLELNSAIPANWNRVWAGWDRSDTNPAFVVGIHHPSGDIMKICRDDSGVIKKPNGSPTAQTWEITSAGNGWEIGVTEPGSSGSPLFDDNGRIIGQLFGGGAACSGTNDNNALDYYGRFGVSWAAGGNATNQLKDWLDPVGSNPTTLESLPPLQVFALDGSASSSIPDIVCGTFDVTPTIVVRNAGSTTLTSLTINWDIDGGASTVINWTGSLAQNETENIVLSPITVTSGAHIFNVSSTNPNGGTDENTTNDVSATNFSLTDEFNTSQVHLELLTDDFSNETTWEFKDSNGTVLGSGGPYDGTTQDNTTFTAAFDVVLGECYSFEIFDSAGDGICCGYGIGNYSLTTDDNTVIISSSGQFGSSELTEMNIKTTLAVNDQFLENNITLYPNPTTGIVQIRATGLIGDLKYEVYNMLGQTLLANKLTTAGISLGNFPNAVYFVKLTEVETNRSLVKKMVLNK